MISKWRLKRLFLRDERDVCIYIYIYGVRSSVTDRARSEAKYGGHGGPKLRRFQSPLRNFYYTRKYERPRRETETT